MTRSERRELLKDVYDSQVRENPRDSEGAQMTYFIEDAIRALPYGAIDRLRDDLEVMFGVALKLAEGK